MKIRIRDSISFIIILITLSSVEAGAQSNWIDDKSSFSAKIEFFKGRFKNYDRSDYMNAIFYRTRLSGYSGSISLKKKIGSSYWLISEIPFARTDYRYLRPYHSEEYNNTEAGIPYFGIEIWDNDSRVRNRIGIRYRFRSERDFDALGGIYSNAYNFDSFKNMYTSLRWTISFIYEYQVPVKWRFGFGPLVFIPHSRNSDLSNEIFGTFGSDLLVNFGNIDACMGICGFTHLTADSYRSDNTEMLIGFGPNINIKRFNFGMRMNYPLGRHLSEILDFAVGAYLNMKIIE